MKTKVIIAAIGLLAAGIGAQAQDKWSLQQCIDFALQHNLTVQQKALACNYQELNLKTSQLSFVPDLNAGVNQNFSFGRATGNDNITTSQSMASTGFSVSTSMPIFTGLRVTNQIKADKLNLLAAVEDLNKAKEDVSLNVASYYLNVLYNKDLLVVAEHQVQLSAAQVENTAKMVANGKKSEAELYENRAQLATDEQKRTEAANAVRLAVLTLCQAINYSDVAQFDVADCDVEALLDATLNTLASPENAYHASLGIRPSIKAAELRIESSKRDLKVAQSAYYPQLDLHAGYNTGYYHAFGRENLDFGRQLGDNSSEMIALSLSIPIFDRMATPNRVKQARINILNQELALENEKQALLKEIQTAYYNAVAARDKYLAADKTVEASRVAFEFEQAKYENGKSTPFDYNNAKTRYESAQTEALQAKYEFIFRTKIFDFYNGSAISL